MQVYAEQALFWLTASFRTDKIREAKRKRANWQKSFIRAVDRALPRAKARLEQELAQEAAQREAASVAARDAREREEAAVVNRRINAELKERRNTLKELREPPSIIMVAPSGFVGDCIYSDVRLTLVSLG